jgi:hypothetical protein
LPRDNEKRTVAPIGLGFVTKFGNSGDSALPCHNSNSAATTSNPKPRTGRMSASLETTEEVGESLTGEPLRHPLPAKQRSSPTRPLWLRAYASPDPHFKGSKLSPCGQYAPAAALRKADALTGLILPLGAPRPRPAIKLETCSPLAVIPRLALAMLGVHCFSLTAIRDPSTANDSSRYAGRSKKWHFHSLHALFGGW